MFKILKLFSAFVLFQQLLNNQLFAEADFVFKSFQHFDKYAGGKIEYTKMGNTEHLDLGEMIDRTPHTATYALKGKYSVGGTEHEAFAKVEINLMEGIKVKNGIKNEYDILQKLKSEHGSDVNKKFLNALDFIESAQLKKSNGKDVKQCTVEILGKFNKDNLVAKSLKSDQKFKVGFKPVLEQIFKMLKLWHLTYKYLIIDFSIANLLLAPPQDSEIPVIPINLFYAVKIDQNGKNDKTIYTDVQRVGNIDYLYPNGVKGAIPTDALTGIERTAITELETASYECWRLFGHDLPTESKTTKDLWRTPAKYDEAIQEHKKLHEHYDANEFAETKAYYRSQAKTKYTDAFGKTLAEIHPFSREGKYDEIIAKIQAM